MSPKINGFLLDTTCLINILRNNQETLKFCINLSDEYPLASCPITVAEIFSGLRPGEIERVNELLEATEYYPVSYYTARQAGLLRHSYAKKGINLSMTDLLIASVAIKHSLILVTKNVRHFPMPELNVIQHP
ncbi:MAG: type II toxin-antitoxin system VapC family toxin [Bacillota bacterium]|nr:type II toxin-antitoxin system VapC family toxin [Bacillota bacterium]